jgi:hypothetical protein
MGGRPALAVVVLEDSGGTVSVAEAFEVTSATEELASQLYTLHGSVVTRVRGLLPIDRAVVRRADKPRAAVNTEGPRLRLLAEGAVISAARAVVPDTRVGAGVDLGRWHSSDKATVDRAAADLIAASGCCTAIGLSKRLGLAAAAALSGAALPF